MLGKLPTTPSSPAGDPKALGKSLSQEAQGLEVLTRTLEFQAHPTHAHTSRFQLALIARLGKRTDHEAEAVRAAGPRRGKPVRSQVSQALGDGSWSLCLSERGSGDRATSARVPSGPSGRWELSQDQGRSWVWGSLTNTPLSAWHLRLP